jgi:hypothetical protein
MRSIAPVSVAVPTVERGSAPIRCDSAAIVLKTSELLPEPDTPGEHRQPALRKFDVDVFEVVHARALHSDQVVVVAVGYVHGLTAPR